MGKALGGVSVTLLSMGVLLLTRRTHLRWFAVAALSLQRTLRRGGRTVSMAQSPGRIDLRGDHFVGGALDAQVMDP